MRTPLAESIDPVSVTDSVGVAVVEVAVETADVEAVGSAPVEAAGSVLTETLGSVSVKTAGSARVSMMGSVETTCPVPIVAID